MLMAGGSFLVIGRVASDDWSVAFPSWNIVILLFSYEITTDTTSHQVFGRGA